MAGAAYPKPDNERVNRAAPAFGWTELPAENPNPVPELPFRDKWDFPPHIEDWWHRLWKCPQSTQWEYKESFFFRYATLMEELVEHGSLTGAGMTEMRQMEDRLGLNPKAMLQLRWRVTKEAAQVQPLAVVKNIGDKPKRVDPRAI